MWEIGRRLGHYGDHPRPRVADRGTPSRVDKRVAPDREGAADKQCQREGKLWSQYVITNREEGKGKLHRLFPKTGYPLGYPEPALQQKTEERERIDRRWRVLRMFYRLNWVESCDVFWHRAQTTRGNNVTSCCGQSGLNLKPPWTQSLSDVHWHTHVIDVEKRFTFDTE